jgi:hypothetical protein
VAEVPDLAHDLYLAAVETVYVDPATGAFSTYLIAAPDLIAAEHAIRDYPLSGGQVRRIWKLAQNVVRVWSDDGGPLNSTPAGPAGQDEIVDMISQGEEEEE